MFSQILSYFNLKCLRLGGGGWGVGTSLWDYTQAWVFGNQYEHTELQNNYTNIYIVG